VKPRRSSGHVVRIDSREKISAPVPTATPSARAWRFRPVAGSGTAWSRAGASSGAGGSFFGCLPLEQHFGLGEATAADGLEIRWPSGLVQRLERPPVNTTIRVVEGRDGWERIDRARTGPHETQ